MKANQDCINIERGKDNVRRKRALPRVCVPHVYSDEELIELAQRLGSEAATESYEKIREACNSKTTHT